jgi:signal transduction histidine kinase
MEEVLSKLRKKFVVTTALIAGVFLLVILGGFFVTLYLTSESVTAETLEDAVAQGQAPFSANKPCYVFYDVNGRILYQDSRTLSNMQSYYGDELDSIIGEATEKGGGNFSYGNYSFAVLSRREGNVTVYALYDRTSEHLMLVKTAVIESLLYVLSMLLAALLAYILSWRNVRPVKTALEKQRDLISNASHELKTPLTIIATNLDVMKSEPQSSVESNSKWLNSAESQISRMKGLIQNMLELSKMEQSRLTAEEVDFSSLASGVCLAFEAVCFEKHLRLLTDIKDGITVSGDKAALERLIMILLDNAVKYAKENGKIGVRLCSDAKKLHLSVLNTGESISAADAKHVFDRFYRADGARANPDNQSFGLGLAIAQATVFAHKGQISCRGIDNKGTVFEVVLPLARKKQDAKRKLGLLLKFGNNKKKDFENGGDCEKSVDERFALVEEAKNAAEDINASEQKPDPSAACAETAEKNFQASSAEALEKASQITSTGHEEEVLQASPTRDAETGSCFVTTKSIKTDSHPQTESGE